MILEDDKSIFEGKSFSDLLKDIYNNSEKKKKQIDILIRELSPMVKTVNEAAVIVPLIKEYLEVGVKNDEQLVKMASIFQKYMAAEKRLDSIVSPGGGGILTREEKEQLLKEVADDFIKSENLDKNVINDNFEELEIKAKAIVDDFKNSRINITGSMDKE